MERRIGFKKEGQAANTSLSTQTSRAPLHAAYSRTARKEKNTLQLLAKPPPIHEGKLCPKQAGGLPQPGFHAYGTNDCKR
jgi:hypothetical protein